MNFEDLYTIKTKLESIYLKLEEIDSNKYDSSELKKAFKLIDSMFDKYDEVPNSINTGTLVKTQNKELTNLLKITISLEEYVDKVHKSFRIFNDIKNVSDLYNKKQPTKEEFNECLKVILNDLLDYKFLISQGYFTEDRFNNELSPTLYRLILDEAKYNGTYTILNTLENMNIDLKSIESLLNEDIVKFLNNDDIKKRVKEIDSQVFKRPKMDRKIILLVSMYNSNYKNKLKNMFDKRLRDIKKANENYKDYLILKNKALKENKDGKKSLKKARKQLRHQILPIILSASILLGVNIGMSSLTRNYKHKTGSSYSTVYGESDYDVYDNDNTKVGDVIVEMFSEKRDNGERDYKKYVYSNKDIPALDLEYLDISDEYLVESSHHYSKDSLSDSEYTNIAVIENVDKDTSTYALSITLHLIVSAVWVLLDILISMITEVGFTGILFPLKDNYREISKDIKRANENIRWAKAHLYTLNDGRTFSEEELKKRKEYLDKLINEYNDLINEYNHLVDEVGIQRKLKL